MTSLWIRPIEWLKPNFASCMVHLTRSLDVLIRSTSKYFIYNMVFYERNLRYDYKHSVSQRKSFERVVCFILTKDIGRWLPWMLSCIPYCAPIKIYTKIREHATKRTTESKCNRAAGSRFVQGIWNSNPKRCPWMIWPRLGPPYRLNGYLFFSPDLLL